MHRIVFLGSTGKDLRNYRRAVIDHLSTLDHYLCEAPEDPREDDANTLPQWRERVLSTDIFVGLIGRDRGWEPPADQQNRSIIELEYDWAGEAGRPRLIFFAPEDASLPAPASTDGEAAARQAQFRERLMGADIVDQDCFTTPHDLAASVALALANHTIGSVMLAGQPGPAGAGKDRFQAAARTVAQVAAEEDTDAAELARRGVDVADIQTRLGERASACNTDRADDRRHSALYHRQIGSLAVLHDTQMALDAYTKAVALDPDAPEGWIALGELQHRKGARDTALRSFERGLELSVTAGRKDLEAAAAGNLAAIHRASGNLERAEAIFARQLALTEELDDKAQQAESLGELGMIYRSRGDLERAETMHKRQLDLADSLGLKKYQAVAASHLGLIHEARGELEEARAMLSRALGLAEELGIREQQAAISGNLGMVYFALGDLKRAEETLARALELAEALGSKTEQAAMTANLGLIHEMQGDLYRAEEVLHQALALYDNLGDKAGVARQFGNLGSIYQARGDVERAEEMFRRDLELSEELGSKEGQAAACGNLGLLCLARGEYDRAEGLFRRDLDLSGDIGSTEGQAAANVNLGSVYKQKGDTARACAHWARARNLFREIGSPTAEQVEGWMREAGCPED